MKQTLPKLNLILIAVSFVIIVIGFALMVGVGDNLPVDRQHHQRENDVDCRRITVGPMISLAGFVLMLFAILFRAKKK